MDTSRSLWMCHVISHSMLKCVGTLCLRNTASCSAGSALRSKGETSSMASRRLTGEDLVLSRRWYSASLSIAAAARASSLSTTSMTPAME